MKKVTNKEARVLVENKAEFKGSNLMGIWVNGYYKVISYGWYPVLVWDGHLWFENKEGYSPSTKRQISNVKPYDTILISYEGILELCSALSKSA